MANELILIVEDNPNNLKLVRDSLQVKGYQTIAAETGEEGVRLAHERHPALILMDIQLRGSVLNGVELNRLFRSPCELVNVPTYARDLPTVTVPIFFVTAYADSGFSGTSWVITADNPNLANTGNNDAIS